MTNTEHFGLNIVDGNDIVNPLVQTNPNFEMIDNQLFQNQITGIQNATELKNGTVHAITRLVKDSPFITFTATSNYEAGDTFTVDGTQVSALTVGGEALKSGAYVINSQVLCVLKGTLLTVYGVGSNVADNALALDGHGAEYFGTAADVQNAIETANAAKTIADNLGKIVLYNEVNQNPSSIYNFTVANITEYKYFDMYFKTVFDNPPVHTLLESVRFFVEPTLTSNTSAINSVTQAVSPSGANVTKIVTRPINIDTQTGHISVGNCRYSSYSTPGSGLNVICTYGSDDYSLIPIRMVGSKTW